MDCAKSSESTEIPARRPLWSILLVAPAQPKQRRFPSSMGTTNRMMGDDSTVGKQSSPFARGNSKLRSYNQQSKGIAMGRLTEIIAALNTNASDVTKELYSRLDLRVDSQDNTDLKKMRSLLKSNRKKQSTLFEMD